MRIIVINDDPIQYESILLTLETMNASVHSVHLNRIVVNPDCVADADLIMIDLDISNLNEKITFVRQYCSKPILVLSACDDHHVAASALNAGADDFLVKPLENRVLIAHINSLLKRSAPNLITLPI